MRGCEAAEGYQDSCYSTHPLLDLGIASPSAWTETERYGCEIGDGQRHRMRK